MKQESILDNITKLRKELWQHRVVRFLCVGSFNTLLDFTVLNILVELAGFPVLVANSISVSIGISISYFLNHRVVFRHPQKYSLKTYARFFFVTGFGVIIIQNLVIYASSKIGIANSDNTVHLLLMNVSDKTVVLNIAKALAVLIGMIWNFLLYKYVIFGESGKPDKDDQIVVA